MVYFDNAATGGFKPRASIDAAENVIKFLCANPGRSAHRLSVAGANIVYSCRETVGDFFGANPDNVIFTKNCTEALNLAIFGTLKKGGHVITTVYEHNSVLRPLHVLSMRGDITLTVVNGENLLLDIKNSITPDTYMIVATSVSNVTGEALPIDKIGEIARDNKLLFLVDGAQGGGHIPINLKTDNISMLALAGHKGLGAIMGIGALLFNDNVKINPLTFGGTGTETFNLIAPENYPDKLEAGTLNLPAIASMLEGVRYVKNNLNNFAENLSAKTERLINGLKSVKNVTLYSTPNPSGIVSFIVDGVSSGETADILNHDYDIAVRSGFHCAPLLHKYLKTDKSGLIRASLSVSNSVNEINYFLRAIKNITS